MPKYKSTDPKAAAKLRYFEKRALLAKVCDSTEARLSVHVVYSELCEAEREAFGSVAMPVNP